jgi:archaellum component FlaF (FlaF/FlaG flagellin family)
VLQEVTDMLNRIHIKTRLLILIVATLVSLGMAYSTKADTLTFAGIQVYYAGDPSEGMDNPWGVTNPGGNAISILGMTPAGAPGTLTFDTGGNPGVSLVSSTPGLFDVNLYGDTTNIISAGKLVTGSYTFNSPSDTFEINGFTNAGANPVDAVTINVAADGVVTLGSSSLELVTDPPSGVPEVDPTSAMSPPALLAGAVLIIRGRRPMPTP